MDKVNDLESSRSNYNYYKRNLNTALIKFKYCIIYEQKSKGCYDFNFKLTKATEKLDK